MDDFVTIGSALPQLEEDEIASRKPVLVHEQVVRDDQGRIRFHGAFTGGFSAGYFNSVDTKEGWAPKTFKSSRADRRGIEGNARPEDFMDDEDFGEFGIAPKKLFTSGQYQGGGSRPARMAPRESVLTLFSNSHLQKCVEPARVTVGQKLLRKMGWRSFGGDACNNQEEGEEEEEEERVFGCALPPSLRAKKPAKKNPIGIKHDVVSPVDFSIRNNQFGLGYKGLAPQIERSKRNQEPRQGKGRGIRGQAFGVGALEEDDDDIYAGENISNYNPVLYLDDEEPELSPIKKRPSGVKSSKSVSGFNRSSATQTAGKVYLAPEIPEEFTRNPGTLKPNLTSNPKSESINQVNQKPTGHRLMTSFKRGEMLNEKPQITSVFDLISEKDRARLEEFKQKFVQARSDGSEKLPESTNAQCQQNEKQALLPQAPNYIPNAPADGDEATHREEAVTEWEKEQKGEISARSGAFSSYMSGRFAKESQTLEVKEERNAKKEAAAKKSFGHLTREVVAWHPAKLLCVRFNVEDPYPESSLVGLPTQKKSKLSIYNLDERELLLMSRPRSITEGNLAIAGGTCGDEETKPSETKPPQDAFTRTDPKPSSQGSPDSGNKGGSRSKFETDLRLPSSSKPLAILAKVDLRPSANDPSGVTLIPADLPDEVVLNQQNKGREETTFSRDESDEEKETPAPSVDIFKAIFEDDDDSDDDDDGNGAGKDEEGVAARNILQQSSSLIEKSGERSTFYSNSTEIPMEWEERLPLSSDDRDTSPQKKDDSRKEKRKHKKDKHEDRRKHKHKSKKSKGSRRDCSSDKSNRGHSDLDTLLLSKLRSLR